MVVTTNNSAHTVQRYPIRRGAAAVLTWRSWKALPIDLAGTLRRAPDRTARNRAGRFRPRSCGHDRGAWGPRIQRLSVREVLRTDPRCRRARDGPSRETGAHP